MFCNGAGNANHAASEFIHAHAFNLNAACPRSFVFCILPPHRDPGRRSFEAHSAGDHDVTGFVDCGQPAFPCKSSFRIHSELKTTSSSVRRPGKASGVVDDAQCFAPIFNDSLANLVKSQVKHRRRMVRRIALRNFCREEFFGRALKIFVYLFLVVRHLQPPRFDVLSG
jgi:hypothetical protein